MKTYEAFCLELVHMRRDSIQSLLALLNSRNVESIYLKPYQDEGFFETPYVYLSDKKDHIVRAYICAFINNKRGRWSVVLSDERDKEVGTYELLCEDVFDVANYIDMLGVVEDIFRVSDKELGGKILCKEESFAAFRNVEGVKA